MSDPIVVKFIKLDPVAKIPTKHLDAACFDLYSIQDVLFTFSSKSSCEEIHTGIALEIPSGYVGFIHTRSGMGFRGFRAHPGVIDPDYRGEITIKLFSPELNNSYPIPAGSRVAQIFFAPILNIVLEEVCGQLSETIRGANGMGSSGI